MSAYIIIESVEDNCWYEIDNSNVGYNNPTNILNDIQDDGPVSCSVKTSDAISAFEYPKVISSSTQPLRISITFSVPDAKLSENMVKINEIAHTHTPLFLKYYYMLESSKYKEGSKAYFDCEYGETTYFEIGSKLICYRCTCMYESVRKTKIGNYTTFVMQLINLMGCYDILKSPYTDDAIRLKTQRFRGLPYLIYPSRKADIELTMDTASKEISLKTRGRTYDTSYGGSYFGYKDRELMHFKSDTAIKTIEVKTIEQKYPLVFVKDDSGNIINNYTSNILSLPYTADIFSGKSIEINGGTGSVYVYTNASVGSIGKYYAEDLGMVNK